MSLPGILFLLGAELLFSSSTLFAKLASISGGIPGFESVFVRFFLGIFIALIYMRQEKSSFRPKRLKWVLLRGVFNTLAVLLFFWSLQFTTITNANLLNMTYPAYLFIIAPFITGDRVHPSRALFLLLTLAGVALVIRPDFHNGVSMGDIIGLASGVLAAFGVSTLRQARREDSSSLILFYLMSIGTVLSFGFMLPIFVMPRGISILWVVLSALCGVMGQVLITEGYRFMKAQNGGLISSSRIIFASTLGIIFLHEQPTLYVIAGSALIFLSITLITLLDGKTKPKVAPPVELE